MALRIPPPDSANPVVDSSQASSTAAPVGGAALGLSQYFYEGGRFLFIFLPIAFHAAIGIKIWLEGKPNSIPYPYWGNFRYTLQRATGMIAFVFIFWHVFHMHGWFHADAWMQRVAMPLGGGMFRAYNATSTAAEAMQISSIVPILYTIGVLSCVFHLANGIWTFCISWGITIGAQAQRKMGYACAVVGIVLFLWGGMSLYAFANAAPVGNENSKTMAAQPVNES